MDMDLSYLRELVLVSQLSCLITSMDFAEVRPERGGGPLSGEKSEKSRPESLDLLLWHLGSEVKSKGYLTGP